MQVHIRNHIRNQNNISRLANDWANSIHVLNVILIKSFIMSDKKHLAPQLAAAQGVILAMNTKTNPEGKSQRKREKC